MTTTLRFQPMRRVLEFVARWGILPIFLLSEAAYFIYFVVTVDGCTGTSTGYFATMIICQPLTIDAFFIDLIVIGLALVVVWIWAHKTKHSTQLRVLILLWFLVLRFAAIGLASRIQAFPFTP